MTDTIYDDGEEFCEGDIAPEDVDWEAVEKLQALQDEALTVPADDRPMAMLALLTEMHGDDLVVL
jgi:hypothetical protein